VFQRSRQHQELQHLYSKAIGKKSESRRMEFQQGKKNIQLSYMVIRGLRERKQKTYNSGYSLVVTHLTTNPPVRCLNRAERTGSLVFNVLWSYVFIVHSTMNFIVNSKISEQITLSSSSDRIEHHDSGRSHLECTEFATERTRTRTLLTPYHQSFIKKLRTFCKLTISSQTLASITRRPLKPTGESSTDVQ
jgi:hypothetical protein